MARFASNKYVPFLITYVSVGEHHKEKTVDQKKCTVCTEHMKLTL